MPDYKSPTRRLLKIFATDPMQGRTAWNQATLDIPNEPLKPGPAGSRVEVIDYDGARGRYYTPIDLNHESVLMNHGLDPTESDPRFHQQMVYAVAMKVIENFERAMGRKIYFRMGRPLRLFPHAFNGANAFYDPNMIAIFFGYFRADSSEPGPNLPGQNVFTCLSQDIIAHEMTHALVHRLHPFFIEPSNRDVLGFHEGFSDIVAIFQHFSFKEILREHIQRSKADLRSSEPLFELAQQFGYATGTGQALRSGLDRPDPKLYKTLDEPHERGSILVAAVLDAFLKVYQRRIMDLVRIATGGTGRLPDGYLHPDLVERIALEASATAQRVLTMCIRALDYLPPVDITYGDYLRALVTADYELSPQDEAGLRAAMIEAFRVRGIYPDGVVSLAEESLLWDKAHGLGGFPVDFLGDLTIISQRFSGSFSSLQGRAERKLEKAKLAKSRSEIKRLETYAKENAGVLFLDPGREIKPMGSHLAFRVASDGQLLIEVVAQFAQEDGSSPGELGGYPFRGGTTVVASAEGTIRYIIAKPVGSGAKVEESNPRFERQRRYVRDFAMRDPGMPWGGEKYLSSFLRTCTSFSMIHRDIAR